MFEKFTDRARKSFVYANQQAKSFNHEYIGVEHILLGILSTDGLGSRSLNNNGITYNVAKKRISHLVRRGPDVPIVGKLPHTPRVKKVVEIAIEESRNLGDAHIGTEHLVLGLLGVKEGFAYQVISENADPEDIRSDAMRFVSSSLATPANQTLCTIGPLIDRKSPSEWRFSYMINKGYYLRPNGDMEVKTPNGDIKEKSYELMRVEKQRNDHCCAVLVGPIEWALRESERLVRDWSGEPIVNS